MTVAVDGLAPVTTAADAAGHYSVAAPLPGTDGTYGVTVMATDLAGNDSAVSAPVMVQVDRTGPGSAPSISPPLPALTRLAGVTVSGTTEANATVTVAVDGLAPVTTAADAAGHYSVAAPLPGTDGTYGVTVMATDLAGNDSAVSAPVMVQVDRAGPASAPSVDPALPALTRLAGVTVSGTTEANATVTIAVAGLAPVTTVADAAGHYSVAAPLPGDGRHVRRDGEGDRSRGERLRGLGPGDGPGGPDGPGDGPDDGSAPDADERRGRHRVGDDGGQRDGDGPGDRDGRGDDAGRRERQLLGLRRAAGGGRPVQRDGEGDGSGGNDSSGSAPASVQVDRTAPGSAPTVNPALPPLTNAASVTVAGMTEPNATVTVLVNGAHAVTTSADGAGAYSVAAPLPPADATYSVQVRARDLAGNLSPVSPASSVQLDRTAPAPAVIDAPTAGATLPPGFRI